ncbi:hypothetical protein [Halocynthiibacter sp.]|uniref:hypothetical protein n=1 Tax=Halocynthiibacter sp. TaxID=1979210 RepID=UPI003C67E543
MNTLTGMTDDMPTSMREAVLSSEIERLREALKPFAEYMEGMGRDNKGKQLPDDQGVGWVYLTHGDFRNARLAMGMSAISAKEATQ